MNFEEQLKNIEEIEREIYLEMDFFNYNIEWWSSEFNRVSNKLQEYERRGFAGVSEKETDHLVRSMYYLSAKGKVEQKVAESIDNKLRKLKLRRELLMIQGDYNHNPGCQHNLSSSNPPSPPNEHALSKKRINIKNKNY